MRQDSKSGRVGTGLGLGLGTGGYWQHRAMGGVHVHVADVSEPRRRLVIDVSMLGLAGATAAAAVGDAPPTVRTALTACAVALVPGAAVLTPVRVADPLTWLALAVTLSLTEVVVAAAVTVRFGWWRPEALLAGGGVAAVAMFVIDIAAAGRTARRAGTKARGGRTDRGN